VNLISTSSGKCLQPIQQSQNQGDAFVQQTCNGSAAQQWTVHKASGTTLHLIEKDSGLCLISLIDPVAGACRDTASTTDRAPVARAPRYVHKLTPKHRLARSEPVISI
jgi:hypothetical protein